MLLLTGSYAGSDSDLAAIDAVLRDFAESQIAESTIPTVAHNS
ncbi:hypothetical protein Z945_1355 [Sulfitobacter noctilucae]|nr:hypothetical protein Z945_1355 [Sulfitobacter noctilucae]